MRYIHKQTQKIHDYKYYVPTPTRCYRLRVDNIDKRITCGIVVIYNNKILIVKEKYSGLYGFPKGKRQMFATDKRWCETLFEAGKRELREETSINLDKINYVSHYRIGKNYNYKRNDQLYLWIVELRDPLDVKSLKANDEIKEIIWTSLDRLKQNYKNHPKAFNESISHFFNYYYKYENKVLKNNKNKDQSKLMNLVDKPNVCVRIYQR